MWWDIKSMYSNLSLIQKNRTTTDVEWLLLIKPGFQLFMLVKKSFFSSYAAPFIIRASCGSELMISHNLLSSPSPKNKKPEKKELRGELYIFEGWLLMQNIPKTVRLLEFRSAKLVDRTYNYYNIYDPANIMKFCKTIISFAL